MKTKSAIKYNVHEEVHFKARGRKKPIVPDVPRPPGVSKRDFLGGDYVSDVSRIGSWTKIRLDSRKPYSQYASLYLMDASSFFPSINLIVLRNAGSKQGSAGVSFQAKGGTTYIVRFFIHVYPDSYKFEIYSNASSQSQSISLLDGYHEVPVIADVTVDGEIDVQIRLIPKNAMVKIEAIEIQRVKT
jgi:hypothetical protein